MASPLIAREDIIPVTTGGSQDWRVYDGTNTCWNLPLVIILPVLLFLTLVIPASICYFHLAVGGRAKITISKTMKPSPRDSTPRPLPLYREPQYYPRPLNYPQQLSSISEK